MQLWGPTWPANLNTAPVVRDALVPQSNNGGGDTGEAADTKAAAREEGAAGAAEATGTGTEAVTAL
jgi:hypothetical protein